MGFFAAVASGFAKYAVFDGRASRSEYWWLHLFYALLGIVLGTALATAIGLLPIMQGEALPSLVPSAGLAVGLYHLVFILPLLAVTVRRLHDLDHSGWNILWSFVPVIGPILLLVWFCTRGTPASNRFGLDPLHWPTTS